MNVVFAIFILGCFVTAAVAVGLVMAMSTLAPEGPGAFEGRAAEGETGPPTRE